MKGKHFNKTGDRIECIKAEELLDKFKQAFVGSDCSQRFLQPTRSPLNWCNLLSVPQAITTEDIYHLQVSSNPKVYYYSERDNEMYETQFSEICTFVKELEPWDEIDTEIFDDTFEWFIAITHEDISLVQGLQIKEGV